MKPFIILIALLFLPINTFAREAKLDTRKRAASDAGSLILPTTPRKFRQMQRNYRPISFETWRQKLNSLKDGMTEGEFTKILGPRKLEIDRVITSSGRMDTIILDDAYFAIVNIWPKTGQVIWSSPPIAITYQIASE
jgi:hypothetical protein